MNVWVWNVNCIHSCSVSLSVSLYGGVCNNPGSRELEIKGETLVCFIKTGYGSFKNLKTLR